MAPPPAPNVRPRYPTRPGTGRRAAILAAGVIVSLATAAQAQTPRFELIPSDSPTTHYTRPTGVTRDGSIVSGAELAYEPFINPKRPTWFWSPDRGKYNLPGSPTYLDETRIAGDGLHLVNRFGRLTLATNQWSFFDPVPGNDTIGSTFISHDGRVVAGTSEDLGGDDARAFVWTDQTGTIELPAYNGQSAWSQYVYGISGDGRTVVGAMNHPNFVNMTVGFAWNADRGYTIYASAFPTAASFGDDVRFGYGPTRIVGSTVEHLGSLEDFLQAVPTFVSDDGAIAAGRLEPTASFRDFRSFVWTRETGLMFSDDYLELNGISIPDGAVVGELSMSGDGRTFAGILVSEDGRTRLGGFVAVIPSPGAVTFVLAFALAARRRR